MNRDEWSRAMTKAIMADRKTRGKQLTREELIRAMFDGKTIEHCRALPGEPHTLWRDITDPGREYAYQHLFSHGPNSLHHYRIAESIIKRHPLADCAETLRTAKAAPAAPAAEQDPHGLDQHAKGAKLDAGKTRAGLVLGDFARALEAVAEIGTAGADKYSPSGWLHVKNGRQRYTDAMLRHWLAESQGEILCPKSRQRHSAHLAWNALARLELELRYAEDGGF